MDFYQTVRFKRFRSLVQFGSGFKIFKRFSYKPVRFVHSRTDPNCCRLLLMKFFCIDHIIRHVLGPTILLLQNISHHYRSYPFPIFFSSHTNTLVSTWHAKSNVTLCYVSRKRYCANVVFPLARQQAIQHSQNEIIM